MSQLVRNLNLVQLALGVILMAVVLMQNRGSGLSNVFGGSGAIYRTKRGFEKWLFYSTIILVTAFVALSVVIVLARQV